MTNRTIVSASKADGGVREGTGRTAGNEEGYIVGFRETTWGQDDAPVYARGHPFRIIAIYNATSKITGAMARVLIAGHPRVGAR